MHRYKCVALLKTSLSREVDSEPVLWLQSCSSRSRGERSPWMVFIQVVLGCVWRWMFPAFGRRLKNDLHSQSHPFLQDESDGRLVIWRMSAFLTKSCQWMPRILLDTTGPMHQFTVDCPTFRPIKHYREYEDPVQMKLGLSRYTWSPQVSVKAMHCWMSHGAASADLRVTATRRVDHGSQVDKRFHPLNIMPTNMKTGWLMLGGTHCLNRSLLPVYF